MEDTPAKKLIPLLRINFKGLRCWWLSTALLEKLNNVSYHNQQAFTFMFHPLKFVMHSISNHGQRQLSLCSHVFSIYIEGCTMMSHKEIWHYAVGIVGTHFGFLFPLSLQPNCQSFSLSSAFSFYVNRQKEIVTYYSDRGI